MAKVPYHIVLFPDGNRRWAKGKGFSAARGHYEGYKKLIKFCHWCQEKGVKIITAFGFSSENWLRTKKEVSSLMQLLEMGLSDPKNIEDFQKNKVRVKIIGQKEKVPKSLQNVISKIEKLTENNKKMRLNLAVSYGGKWDIVQALQQIVRKKIPLPRINEKLVEKYLTTAGLPDPDLIIRAGGERRLSNFVLWQASYSELYFIDKLWPEFSEKDLGKAIKQYQLRFRRFGK